jgi:DNA-binding CsgD family transcriptional regulator
VATQQDLPLPGPASSGVVAINARCVVRAEGEQRVLFVSGLPVHHYSVQDAVAEAYAMVLLLDGGYATQREVAVAFGCSDRTVQRHLERYADGGMTALATRSGWRPGRRRIPSKRVRVIERLAAQGVSNREIARRLGVTEGAIRKQVGPSVRPALQPPLPMGNAVEPKGDAAQPASTQVTPPAPTPQPVRPAASPEASPAEAHAKEEPAPVALTLDGDPAHRVWDRLLAAFGLLDDAAPIFADAAAVPGAGVLLSLPALVGSGIFQSAAKLYGEIGPAFYGTRTTLLTLLLMALWRIKRPEALKENDPQRLGRVLGLDRAPEVKTVRRKLTRLASYRKAEQLGAELARLRLRFAIHPPPQTGLAFPGPRSKPATPPPSP